MPTALESLLDPISRAEFREQYYSRQPLLVRGYPKKFDGLFTGEDLNRLLEASFYPHPHIQISTAEGRRRAESLSSVVEQCRAGASVIFYEIHRFDPRLGELAHALEAETGAPMLVALILSQASEAALPLHYDWTDGFVLQLDGHKAWSVYDRTSDKPIVPFAVQPCGSPPSHPSLQCELAPGDVLYLPRGHWHQALARGGPSLHLTVVMRSPTGIQFLRWLESEFRDDARFRDELPLSYADEAAAAREERLRAHLAGLRDLLVSRLQDEQTIRSFIDHRAVAERDLGGEEASVPHT